MIEWLAAAAFIGYMWNGMEDTSEDEHEPEETISQMFREVEDIHGMTETVNELRKVQRILSRYIENGDNYVCYKLEWHDDFGNVYSTEIRDARLILKFVDEELEYFTGFVQYLYRKYRDQGDSMYHRYGLFDYLYRNFENDSTRSDKISDKISDKKVNSTPLLKMAGKGFRRASRGIKAVKIPWRK